MKRLINPWREIKNYPKSSHTTYLLRARFPPHTIPSDVIKSKWDRDRQEWTNWPYPSPPTHFAIDPYEIDLPWPLIGDELTVWERERLILGSLTGCGHEEYFHSFTNIQASTSLELKHIRNTVRALARKGYAAFGRGLSTEDGDMAGSGYAITEAGEKYLRDVLEKKP